MVDPNAEKPCPITPSGDADEQADGSPRRGTDGESTTRVPYDSAGQVVRGQPLDQCPRIGPSAALDPARPATGGWVATAGTGSCGARNRREDSNSAPASVRCLPRSETRGACHALISGSVRRTGRQRFGHLGIHALQVGSPSAHLAIRIPLGQWGPCVSGCRPRRVIADEDKRRTGRLASEPWGCPSRGWIEAPAALMPVDREDPFGDDRAPTFCPSCTAQQGEPPGSSALPRSAGAHQQPAPPR